VVVSLPTVTKNRRAKNTTPSGSSITTKAGKHSIFEFHDRMDDQVQRIKRREHYGPCCIYLGSIGFSLNSAYRVRLSRCRQLRKTRMPKYNTDWAAGDYGYE
jgi:hypothetical protein